MPQRLDGNVIVIACARCSQFRYPACSITGEDIPYPVSGPVGKRCPLPKYGENDIQSSEFKVQIEP